MEIVEKTGKEAVPYEACGHCFSLRLPVQQPVAVPDKVRHARGVLLPAAPSECIVAVAGSLFRTVAPGHRRFQLMLRVPAETLHGMVAGAFLRDVAVRVIVPAAVTKYSQTVICQRRRILLSQSA